MEQVDITVIGAGIIGLAVSASVSSNEKSVYVLEKNASFGQETSSRNSEVIHCGMYYPSNSIKAKACVKGNQMIYEICAKNSIPCKKLGKLIVACEDKEITELENLMHNGQQNGVEGLMMLDKKEIEEMEPNIKAQKALYSPNTGIVDTHNLMQYFFQKAKAQGTEFVFRSEVIHITKLKAGFKVNIRDADGSDFSFVTGILINCAGLNSDSVAELSGIDTQEANYRLKFCKGEYFRASGRKSRLIKHLVYPVPDAVSLGIHATPDLQGSLRLGPDAQYIEQEQANYSIDDSKKAHFAQAVNKFLPFIKVEDLSGDIAGIRPKLQGPENGFRDFVICNEEKRGFTGLINLIGIESPGLTAAPCIAKYVHDMVEKII